MDCAAALQLQNTLQWRMLAVNCLAKSIAQLTLCQVTTDEVDAATKDKACQKLRGIPDVPSQDH